MSSFNKKYLFDLLQKGTPLSFLELARKYNVRREDNRLFSDFLFQLVKSGEILATTTQEKQYYLPQIIKYVQGIIRINSKGFGFLDIDSSEESIYFSFNNLLDAMDGDLVRAAVFKDVVKRDAYQGLVKEVLERSHDTVIGTIKKFNDKFGLVPLNARIRNRFTFLDDAKNLKEDFEVEAKIIAFGDPIKLKIIKIFGHKDDPSVDILTYIREAGVNQEFPIETLKESSLIPTTINSENVSDRVDLRDRMIFTIDGDDTKDFDDAIDVRKSSNGNCILGVHIADVTHYVREDSAIDLEARARGTSIYLADRVIPMLPFELSNGICSLNPHVDRLTLSCEMEIGKDGKTVDYKIFPSIICSKHRLTYNQVNDFFVGNLDFEDQELSKVLEECKVLTKTIRDFKNKEGYINFEISESKIIIGDDGKTKDIILKESGESEMMIEDFMVRANETIAFHAFSKDLPFIYRIHDRPEAERIQVFQEIIKLFKINVTIPQNGNPKDFAKAITKIKESRFDDFMKILMLRTMAKAIYSDNNIGHFGLASETYTHFTSPIRRYPDLIVHRMIRTYFFENQLEQASHFKEILPEVAANSSKMEQRAVDLERKVAEIKKAEYYENFIGQEFQGTIVSILKFGFFVEFPNKVDGLVHVSNLMDGKYELDSSGFKLTNNQGRDFTIGQEIKVVVVSAIKKEGKIDLVLADQYEKWKNSKMQFRKTENNNGNRKIHK